MTFIVLQKASPLKVFLCVSYFAFLTKTLLVPRGAQSTKDSGRQINSVFSGMSCSSYVFLYNLLDDGLRFVDQRSLETNVEEPSQVNLKVMTHMLLFLNMIESLAFKLLQIK